MNFIIFMPDELRAESVGSYGHPLAPTPNMDALAAQGVRFDQCHVQHSVCTPSRCSMMTGWYPHVRGHRTLWHLLRPDEPNLLRTLKQAGYQVMWFGKNDLLATASLADSVTVAERRGQRMFGQNPFTRDDPRYYSFLYDAYDGPLAEHGDYANVQAAIDFLRSKPPEPFVLYLPLTFPHCPYSAPQPWHDLIDPDDLPPLRPADLRNRPDHHALIRQYRRLDRMSEDEQSVLLRKIQAVYLGMTGFVDHLLGQLLNELDAAGLADSTTVTVTSDHGDYAGDYGLVEKWPSACEEIITRVPLIVRTPDGAAGHVVAEPVELFDVMATTLEQAGVEARHSHFARSYVRQLHGESGDPTRAAFTEGGYARHEPHCFEGKPDRDQFARDAGNIYFPKGVQQQEHPDSVGRVVAVRTVSHTYIHRPHGQCELYDRALDPRELQNVYGASDYTAIQRKLEQRILDWLVETSDVTPFDIDPRGFAG
ncbi:MAG: sulfatase-like hydrolase/transferase [Caldilineaceae bacterium]|nr:sulfatase-like hydrolase/transferase [Caldilineaceae bacterium]